MSRAAARRLFFVGTALLIASVAPWGWLALDPHAPYRKIFHMMASVQGAGMAFVAAALLNRIDPSRFVTGLLGGLPVLTAATAWFRHALPNEIMLGFSELAWLTNVMVVVPLVWRLREELFADAAARVWGLFGFIGAVVGAALLSTYSMLLLRDIDAPWMVVVGRGLLLEGMPLTALVLFAPRVTAHFGATGKARGSARGALEVVGFVVAQLLEALVSARTGLLVSGLVVAAAYTRCGVPLRLGRAARAGSGWWLAVLAGMWLVLVGYLLAALAPEMRLVGLHLVFVAGFALATLAAFGAQGGRGPRSVRPTGLVMLALVATVLRAWYEADQTAAWALGGAAVLVVLMVLVTIPGRERKSTPGT